MIGETIGDRDEVFGGWINLDTKNQYFSCIAGSHLNIIQKEIESGFDTLAGNYAKYLDDNENHLAEFEDLPIKEMETVLSTSGKREKLVEKAKEQIMTNKSKFAEALVKNRLKQVSKLKVKITVPPGHVVIFPQYILHEVVASPVKHNMLRLFTGWRLTSKKESLYDTLHKYKSSKYPSLKTIMDKQGVPPIPGGMIPPMYSRNHASNFLGIPTFRVVPKNRRKKFKWVKWIREMKDKLLFLFSSEEMKRQAKKFHKNITERDAKLIIFDMVNEYKNIGVRFNLEPEKKSYLEDTYKIIHISTFQTIPSKPKSLTNTIMWSSANMKPNTLVVKTNKKGYRYNIVKRHMESLENYGFPKYPGYSEEEKRLYLPEKLF